MYINLYYNLQEEKLKTTTPRICVREDGGGGGGMVPYNVYIKVYHNLQV
jgi:hypothetical protein